MGLVPLPRRPGQSIESYRADLRAMYEGYYGRRLPRRLPGETDDEHAVRVSAALKKHSGEMMAVAIPAIVAIVVFVIVMAWRTM